jgi:hypothetical protein
MRKYLLFLTFVLTVGYTNAQSLSVSVNEVDCSNGEVTVTGLPTEEHIKVVLNVTNLSSSQISVKLKRSIIQNVEGMYSSFCIGSCYDPTVDESTSNFNIEAGATTGREDIYIDFYPEGHEGVMIIAFEIYNVNNVDDKVTVTVTFNISSTSISAITTSSSLNINSNSSGATVSYSLSKQSANSKLIITNILGVRQFELPINEQTGRIELPTENLPRGIYICSLQTQGRTVVAKKFVVSK